MDIKKKINRKKLENYIAKKDHHLQTKIDHEIRMRDGTAKLLAASKHPQQMLEAAKNLLTSNARMLSYMGELQKRKTDEVLKREFPEDGNQVPCKAKISVSDIRVPLMWKDAEHFRSKGDHRRYAAFCIVKIGTEIYDTALLKDVDRSMTDIMFDDVVCFDDIRPDFECRIEVYCHRCQDDLSVASTPKRIRKKIEDFGQSVGRTVGRRLSGLKDDSDPNMIIGPKFECIGVGCLRLADVSDSVGSFSLDMETETTGTTDLPLFGNVCCRLAAQPYCLVQNTVAGELYIQDTGTLSWKPYWCRLRKLAISCWLKKECAETSVPDVVIPVTKTSQLSEVPASLCKRDHCIQVTSQTFVGRVSYNIAASDKTDKVRWWDGIYQHLLDQVMWLQACETFMEIRAVTPRRHSVYRRKGLSLYDETNVPDSSSPMTKMLNRLNIPEAGEEEEEAEMEDCKVTESPEVSPKVTAKSTVNNEQKTPENTHKVSQSNSESDVSDSWLESSSEEKPSKLNFDKSQSPSSGSESELTTSNEKSEKKSGENTDKQVIISVTDSISAADTTSVDSVSDNVSMVSDVVFSESTSETVPKRSLSGSDPAEEPVETSPVAATEDKVKSEKEGENEESTPAAISSGDRLSSTLESNDVFSEEFEKSLSADAPSENTHATVSQSITSDTMMNNANDEEDVMIYSSIESLNEEMKPDSSELQRKGSNLSDKEVFDEPKQDTDNTQVSASDTASNTESGACGESPVIMIVTPPDSNVSTSQAGSDNTDTPADKDDSNSATEASSRVEEAMDLNVSSEGENLDLTHNSEDEMIFPEEPQEPQQEGMVNLDEPSPELVQVFVLEPRETLTPDSGIHENTAEDGQPINLDEPSQELVQVLDVDPTEALEQEESGRVSPELAELSKEQDSGSNVADTNQTKDSDNIEQSVSETEQQEESSCADTDKEGKLQETDSTSDGNIVNLDHPSSNDIITETDTSNIATTEENTSVDTADSSLLRSLEDPVLDVYDSISSPASTEPTEEKSEPASEEKTEQSFPEEADSSLLKSLENPVSSAYDSDSPAICDKSMDDEIEGEADPEPSDTSNMTEDQDVSTNETTANDSTDKLPQTPVANGGASGAAGKGATPTSSAKKGRNRNRNKKNKKKKGGGQGGGKGGSNKETSV